MKIQQRECLIKLNSFTVFSLTLIMFFFSCKRQYHLFFLVWLFFISTETLNSHKQLGFLLPRLVKDFLNISISFIFFFENTKCLFEITERMSYFERNWSSIGCATCLNNHGLKQAFRLGWVWERLIYDWSWVTKSVLCELRQTNEQVISISVLF